MLELGIPEDHEFLITFIIPQSLSAIWQNIQAVRILWKFCASYQVFVTLQSYLKRSVRFGASADPWSSAAETQQELKSLNP